MPRTHGRGLAHEDHCVVEATQVVEDLDGVERHIVELVAPVGQPGTHCHHAGVHAAPVQLADLADREVL